MSLSSSPYSYVVTARKPTSVTHSITARLTETDDWYLIISKSTLLEIHRLTPNGLQHVLEVNIYGKIAVLEAFRSKDMDRSYLFVCTQRYQAFLLSYRDGKIVTEAQVVDINDPRVKPSEGSLLSTIHPSNNLICLYFFIGQLTLIDMANGKVSESFPVRLEHPSPLSIQFLHLPQPVLAVLYADKNARHIVTYEVNLETKELIEGPWNLQNVESGAKSLIPTPNGGVVIIGEQSLTYYNGSRVESTAMQPTEIQCYGCIDRPSAESKRFRYMLGDIDGGLYILSLNFENSVKPNLVLERLGQTTQPTTITYLDNRVVYIGSLLADSQLIQLLPQKNAEGSYVEVLETFPSVGPVVDFCVIDLERHGQGQLVACSSDGALRVIRNDVGINEQAVLDVPGLKGSWSLRNDADLLWDTLMVITFFGETRFLWIRGDELEDTDIPFMISNESTLHCANIGDNILQITPHHAILVSNSAQKVLSSWKHEAEITFASSVGNQVLLAAAGGHLIYLEVENDTFVEKKKTQLHVEISCLNVNILGKEKAKYCVVGLWTEISFQVLDLATLKPVCTEKLEGEIIARSILLINLENVDYVLCAQGDGQFSCYLFNQEAKSLKLLRRLALGSKPVTLNAFQTENATNIFVSSDPPTIVYSNKQKLWFSHVNMRDVNFISPINSEMFPRCIGIITDSSLTIGNVNEIHKLHVRPVPLADIPLHVCHLQSGGYLGVLTIEKLFLDKDVDTQCHFHIFNSNTFEKLATYTFEPSELANCICAVTIPEIGECFAVGCTIVRAGEDEPKQSRLYLLTVERNAIKLVAQKDVAGGTNALAPFGPSKFTCAISNRVHIYKYLSETSAIVEECGISGFTITIDIKTQGDFVLIGDLMSSLLVAKYNVIESRLDLVAKDMRPVWTTAVAFLEDDLYLGAEHGFNLLTLQRNVTGTAGKLTPVGDFHVGHAIHSIRKGSLVMLSETNKNAVPTVLFCSNSGMIGVVASLTKEYYDLLYKIQNNLNNVIQGIGGLSHSEWRSICTQARKAPCTNFIDGDLIEKFLELTPEQMEIVVNGSNHGMPTGKSVEEITLLIEDLVRLH